MNKYRVLIVHNYYQLPGGEGIVVENEKKMLENNGHEVFLYSKNNNEINDYNIFKKALLPIKYLFNLETYIDIKKIIREKNIDIVHVHNTINIISDSVYYAAFKCNVPVVKTIHNFRLLCPNGLFYREGKVCEDCAKYGLDCATKHNCYRNNKLETLLTVLNLKIQRSEKLYSKLYYICLTEFNKKKLLTLDQIKEENIYIKPNFVDENRELLEKSKRDKQFVFVGRLDEYKGIKFLFNAWKHLNNNNLKLVICGTGELEDWCKNFILENSIKNIKILGDIDNSRVKDIMSKSYATIIPSILYEGFPVVYVESLSVGTPVIVNNIGNLGCIVENNISGYKYNNEEELVAAIEKIAKSRGNKLFKSAMNEYKEKYTKEVNYKQLFSIYTDIINRNKS